MRSLQGVAGEKINDTLSRASRLRLHRATVVPDVRIRRTTQAMTRMSTTHWMDLALAVAAKTHAQRQFHRLMRSAATAKKVQERRLQTHLQRNADSTYGREHGFARIRTYADFAARVPIQTYEELRPYVERVMAGETHALLGRRQRVFMFAMTSGSTDQPKYVPVTPAFLREHCRGWHAFGGKAMLDHPQAFLRPILQVVSPMTHERTANGIPCGAISGLLAARQKTVVRRYYAAPPRTSDIDDPEARYYTMMRFAVPRDVGWIVTASPATPIKLARSASSHADRLIRDIHDGTLQPPTNIPREVQETLVAGLRPDRASAKRLAALLDEHDELLPKHYWRLAFLANWTGGTLGLHLQDFPRYFGETPVRDIGLLATEGRVSIGLEDGTPTGLLDIEGGFFEFLDADAHDRDPASIRRCHELLPVCEYRVVMTTSAGFYRYDLGDRVRVRGFVGEAPVLEFLHRGAFVSSITGEKLTEWQATNAFGRACDALGLTARNFVLAPAWSDPPFYRLHLDTRVEDVDRLADSVDHHLSAMNLEYSSKRSSGRLGPVTVNRLPNGILARWDADKVRRDGASHEQYKHRYLYSHPGDDAALPLESTNDSTSTADNDDTPSVGRERVPITDIRAGRRTGRRCP